jgi:enterobactin synthetase component D / holo-[acyl-carrier protein] synthase
MIEQILPADFACAEARNEELGGELYPEEEQVLGRAVEKRRLEFTTGRACARVALARLGVEPAPIPVGERGAPCWPEGIVGSITHCRGYRACAVARSADVLSVGIDAEPNEPLPAGLLEDIASAEEMELLDGLRAQRREVNWDRLLFSAKEAVYKAWFPLAQRWLGFADAVLAIDSDQSRFCARLLLAGPVMRDGRRLRGFSGRWMACDGILITATSVTPAYRRTSVTPASGMMPSP